MPNKRTDTNVTQEIEPSSANDRQGIARRLWRVAPVAMLGPFMAQLDGTLVNIALPAVGQDLVTSISSLKWVLSGYLLALTAVLPLNGWMVDRIGVRRLYVGCFSALVATSILCAMANTVGELIAARIAQGLAAGLLAPMAQLMMARVAGRHMARALGYIALPILIAPTIGPIISAFLLGQYGWRALFLLNVPVGITAIALAITLLPDDKDSIGCRSLDWLALALILPGLVMVMVGLDHASTPVGMLSIVFGMVFCFLFFRRSRKRNDIALVDMDLFDRRDFRVGALIQFAANGSNISAQMLVPLFLLSGCGLSAADAGWLLAAQGVGMAISYPMLGPLTDRFGARLVAITGSSLVCIGTLVLLWISTHQFSTPLMILALVLRGCGQSWTGVPSVSAIYASIPKNRISSATTAVNTAQRLGGPVAITLLALLLSRLGLPAESADPAAFALPFLMLLALGLSVQLLTVRAALLARGSVKGVKHLEGEVSQFESCESAKVDPLQDPQHADASRAYSTGLNGVS